MEPKSREEWEKRFHENQKISGFGMATTMHMPCPFCAAPDFAVYRIIDTEDALVDGAVCKECTRGAAIVFSVNTPSDKQFEMVQTEGPDQPDWLVPAMRRK
jgi:hypothetical protein